MKKPEVSKEAPKASDQPTSNVRSYFTKEINDQILTMTIKEMESLMKDMINTPNWIALLKYTSMRTPILDATLRSVDATKEPGKIMWAQGAMAGLCDIEGYVIDLNAPPVKPVEEPKVDMPAGGRPEGVIMG